jgi:hypothetical protein
MRESTDKELVIAGFVAIGLLISCIAASQILLPENCFLFDNRQIGFTIRDRVQRAKIPA